MNRARLIPTAAAVLAASSLAADKPKQASIPFATTTGIESWRAVGNDTLYIKSRNDQWYRADLFGPCIGLQLDPTIGFVVRFGSTFDRTSSILVDGHECRLSSLVEADGPPAREAQAAESPDRGSSASGARSPGEERPDTAAPARSARIAFADLGAIEDWRAASDEILYIKGRHDQWYRATLFAPCTGLRFQDTIGFVVEPTGTFDRFSSILVEGRECHLASLTESDPPPGARRAEAPK